MEQLAIIETDKEIQQNTNNEQSTTEAYADIMDKYALNDTQRQVIELNLFRRLDYKQIANELNRHPQTINRILNDDNIIRCKAELQGLMHIHKQGDLMTIAQDEAMRMILNRDTSDKVKSELIRHILPEGKRTLDLGIGKQDKQNW